MKTTTLTEKDLLEIGFVKKSHIIHASRVTNEDELWLGQINESGERKELYVYQLPKGFRFEKHIAVNYRNEILLYTQGFMRGGIEAFKDLESSDFYFRESEEWKEEVHRIIEKLKAE